MEAGGTETGGDPPAASPPETTLPFLLPPARVVFFLFFAPIAYELWWLWQLFALTRREGFPNARSFWWIFVPVFGWVVLYQQLDDLKNAAAQQHAPGQAPVLHSRLAACLVVLAAISPLAWSRGVGVPVGLLVSFALVAVAGYLVQPAANAYLQAKYGEFRPTGSPRQQIVAPLRGLLQFVAAVFGGDSAHAPPDGMSRGELAATLIGIVLFLGVVLGSFV